MEDGGWRNLFSGLHVSPSIALVAILVSGNISGAWGETTAANNPQSPIILNLRENIEVGADMLRLCDLIVPFKGETTPGFAIEASLAESALGVAPVLGKSMVVRRSDVEARLRRTHPKLSFAWAGAQQCVVSRPCVEITEAVVTKLIEDALRNFGNNEGDIRVLSLVNYSTILAPKQDAVTEVELVSPNIASRFGAILLSVDYKESSFLRRNVRFEWEWKRPIWIARQTQTEGRIQKDAFYGEKRNILGLSGDPYFAESLNDLFLSRSVKKGEPLMHSNVKLPIAVERGSAVSAQIRSGALLVATQAIALENGSIGQTIRLQISNSNKPLVGKVTHEHVVEIIP